MTVRIRTCCAWGGPGLVVERLVLWVPGLFDAPEASSRPPSTALRLVRQADRCRARGGSAEAGLLSWFGLPASTPLAPFTFLADFGERPEGAVLRADPVWLKAELDHALLFGPYLLDLSMEQARALVERINTHLAEEGWQVEIGAPDRWYVRDLRALGDVPRTASLSHAVRRNVYPLLPEGEEGRAWRRRLTELQMLLHDAPETQAREARGLPPVNSLWFWGGGALPPTLECPFDEIHAQDALSLGLARACAVEAREALRPGDYQGAQVLVARDEAADPARHGDVDAWQAAVDNIEREWLQPLLAQLRKGQLRELILDAGEAGAWRLRSWHRWRFWRSGRTGSGLAP
ncbi:MAG: hypothetical protein PHI49_11180 [Halothiobacillaceae bacterium]|nr:hypothetical protein [Halothiobacillaceae bacterium]